MKSIWTPDDGAIKWPNCNKQTNKQESLSIFPDQFHIKQLALVFSFSKHQEEKIRLVIGGIVKISTHLLYASDYHSWPCPMRLVARITNAAKAGLWKRLRLCGKPIKEGNGSCP